MQEPDENIIETKAKTKRKLKNNVAEPKLKKMKPNVEKVELGKSGKRTGGNNATNQTKLKFAKQENSNQGKNNKPNNKFDKPGKKEQIQQSTTKPDWTQLKKEKKDLKEKRKAQRLSDTYSISIKVKQISEKLRRADCSENDRKNLIQEAHGLLKGHYDKMIFTHDISRIIQWMLKYAVQEIRTAIFCELKPCLLAIFHSKYAKNCIKTIIEHTATVIKNEIVSACYGNIVKLVSSTISAPILEYIYGSTATNQQKIYFKQEFYGDMYKNAKDKNVKTLSDVFASAPGMKTATLTAIKGNLLRLLNKKLLNSSLVHEVLWEFLHQCSVEDKNEMIVMLRSSLLELSQTKYGSKVACICMWHGTNKDKKIMMKALKDNVKKICMSEHGYRVMLALFDSVDDTVLVKKIILSEIQKDLCEIALHEHGKHVILYLVARRDPHYFPPYLVEDLKQGDNNETSKKPGDVKAKELLPAVLNPLLESISTDTQTWLSNNSIAMVTLAILKAGVGEKTQSAFEAIAKFVVDPDSKLVDNDTQHVVVEHVGLHIALKKLIQYDKILLEKEQNTFGEILVNHITSKTIEEWTKYNRGCFLLIVLLENEAESVVKTLLSKLTTLVHKLTTLDSPGGKILLKKLKLK